LNNSIDILKYIIDGEYSRYSKIFTSIENIDALEYTRKILRKSIYVEKEIERNYHGASGLVRFNIFVNNELVRIYRIGYNKYIVYINKYERKEKFKRLIENDEL